MLFVSVGSGLGLHDDDNNDDTAETQTDTLLLYEPHSSAGFHAATNTGVDRSVVKIYHTEGLGFIHVPRKQMKKRHYQRTGSRYFHYSIHIG